MFRTQVTEFMPRSAGPTPGRESKNRSIRATMIELEQKLNPRRFLRVSRSAIVSVDRIREVAPRFNGEFLVTLKSGAQVPFTRDCRQGLVDIRTARTDQASTGGFFPGM